MTIYRLDGFGIYYGATAEYPNNPNDWGILEPPGYYSTVEPPNVGSCESARWDKDNKFWEVVPDFRRSMVWDTVTTKPISIQKPGFLLDTQTLIDPSGVSFPLWNGSSWTTDTKAGNQFMINGIKNKLLNLDGTIPRALEDLYSITNQKPYSNVLEVIKQKNELRKQIKVLEDSQ